MLPLYDIFYHLIQKAIQIAKIFKIALNSLIHAYHGVACLFSSIAMLYPKAHNFLKKNPIGKKQG